MLERLDTIDWAVLRHAYGEARDVPELLRLLLSADLDQRQRAMNELFGNIYHQGTVYPATAAAVPFLYELLTSPKVPVKADIAYLLSCIASGRGYLEVHAVGDFGQRTWRKILGDRGQSLEAALEQEAAEIQPVRQAVSVGLALLIPYLQHSETEVRRSVAEALGNYPEHAAVSVPALEAAAASETDEEVRASLLESIERLNQTL